MKKYLRLENRGKYLCQKVVTVSVFWRQGVTFSQFETLQTSVKSTQLIIVNSGVQISSAPPNRTRPCQSWTSPHSGPIDFLLKIKFNQHATNGFDFSIFIHTWCCKDDLIIYQPGESLTMHYSSIHRWLQVFTKAGRKYFQTNIFHHSETSYPSLHSCRKVLN